MLTVKFRFILMKFIQNVHTLIVLIEILLQVNNKWIHIHIKVSQ